MKFMEKKFTLTSGTFILNQYSRNIAKKSSRSLVIIDVASDAKALVIVVSVLKKGRKGFNLQPFPRSLDLNK